MSWKWDDSLNLGLLSALVPVLYSLWCYHRVEDFGSDE